MQTPRAEARQDAHDQAHGNADEHDAERSRLQDLQQCGKKDVHAGELVLLVHGSDRTPVLVYGAGRNHGIR